jgi:hypothetical protein
MVGPFMSDFYLISGLYLESRKRREHLTDEDLQKNKAMIESLTKGNTSASAVAIDNTNGEQIIQRRKSLPPPTPRNISWEEYMSSTPGQHSPLGRELICKETVKAFKATLAMVLIIYYLCSFHSFVFNKISKLTFREFFPFKTKLVGKTFSLFIYQKFLYSTQKYI